LQVNGGERFVFVAGRNVSRLLSQLSHLLGGGFGGDAVDMNVRGEEKIVDHGRAMFHVGLERVVLRRRGRRGRIVGTLSFGGIVLRLEGASEIEAAVGKFVSGLDHADGDAATASVIFEIGW